jgi:AAT family amino acid transporter
LFPWMQYAGLLLLAAILITMGLDESLRVSWLVGVPWLLLISGAYFVWKSKNAPPVTGVAVSKL